MGKKEQIYVKHLIVISSLLIILLIPTNYATAEPISIKVGMYENGPKIFTTSEGEISGFFPDILESIARKENWNLEYIPGSWNQGLERLQNGEIDVMPDVGYSLERDQLYEFNNESLLSSWAMLWVHDNSQIESIDDLQSKKIAVMKNDIDYIGPQGIKVLSQTFKINCQFIEYNSLEEVFQSIDNKSADAGVVNNLYGNEQMENFDIKKTTIFFNPINFFFAFPDNGPLNAILIERIDYWIGEWKQDYSSEYYEVHDYYFGLEAKPESRIWIIILTLSLIGMTIFTIGAIRLFRNRVRRKSMELNESSLRFQLLFNQYPRPLLQLSPSLEIETWNNFASKFFAPIHPLHPNMSIEEIFLPIFLHDKDQNEFLEILRSQLHTPKIQTLHRIEVKIGDSRRTIEMLIVPIQPISDKLNSLLLILQDITLRLHREETIMQQEKLESLSFLAGGIAHDFNNMLMALLGNINLMKINEATPLDFRNYLTSMEKIVNTAKGVTGQFLTFSKKEIPIRESQNIIQILNDTLNFSLHGSNCKFHFSPPLKEILCEIDKNQITQVINNILVNSQQAMPNGGNINISVKILYFAPENGQIYQNITSQNPNIGNYSYYIQMQFTDDGPGIPNKFKSKIFQPYFTTKPSGSGLGLAISSSIIKKHKGWMELEEIPDKSTAINIFLPLNQQSLTARIRKIAFIIPQFPLYALINEDKSSSVNNLSFYCQKLGISAIVHENAQEIISAYQTHSQAGIRFSVVFIDLSLPQEIEEDIMLQKLLRINPKLKIIAICNYFSLSSEKDLLARKYSGMLEKPYSLHSLQQCLRKSMNF